MDHVCVTSTVPPMPNILKLPGSGEWLSISVFQLNTFCMLNIHLSFLPYSHIGYKISSLKKTKQAQFLSNLEIRTQKPSPF